LLIGKYDALKAPVRLLLGCHFIEARLYFFETALDSSFGRRIGHFLLLPLPDTSYGNILRPIFASGLTVRISSTNRFNSGANWSSVTRRLNELLEGKITAASTTIAPSPPLAILSYLYHNLIMLR